jgi:hypothetical protein
MITGVNRLTRLRFAETEAVPQRIFENLDRCFPRKSGHNLKFAIESVGQL